MLPKNLKWDESYLKYVVLYTLSLLLVVFAIALLFTSNDVSKRKPEFIDELSQIKADKESVALTLTSFLIILTAFIGSCATYNKSKFILISFCVLLILLITVEILCTYTSLRYNYKLNNDEIKEKFQDLTFKYEWTHQNSHINDLVNGIQLTYNCCGTHSYSNWDDLRPRNLSADEYPLSCCHNLYINVTDWCSTTQVNSTNSCFKSLDEKLSHIKTSVAVMAGVAITNSVIKFIAIPIVYYFGGQFTTNFIV